MYNPINIIITKIIVIKFKTSVFIINKNPIIVIKVIFFNMIN